MLTGCTKGTSTRRSLMAEGIIKRQEGSPRMVSACACRPPAFLFNSMAQGKQVHPWCSDARHRHAYPGS